MPLFSGAARDEERFAVSVPLDTSDVVLRARSERPRYQGSRRVSVDLHLPLVKSAEDDLREQDELNYDFTPRNETLNENPTGNRVRIVTDPELKSLPRRWKMNIFTKEKIRKTVRRSRIAGTLIKEAVRKSSFDHGKQISSLRVTNRYPRAQPSRTTKLAPARALMDGYVVQDSQRTNLRPFSATRLDSGVIIPVLPTQLQPHSPSAYLPWSELHSYPSVVSDSHLFRPSSTNGGQIRWGRPGSALRNKRVSAENLAVASTGLARPYQPPAFTLEGAAVKSTHRFRQRREQQLEQLEQTPVSVNRPNKANHEWSLGFNAEEIRIATPIEASQQTRAMPVRPAGTANKFGTSKNRSTKHIKSPHSKAVRTKHRLSTWKRNFG